MILRQEHGFVASRSAQREIRTVEPQKTVIEGTAVLDGSGAFDDVYVTALYDALVDGNEGVEVGSEWQLLIRGPVGSLEIRDVRHDSLADGAHPPDGAGEASSC